MTLVPGSNSAKLSSPCLSLCLLLISPAKWAGRLLRWRKAWRGCSLQQQEQRQKENEEEDEGEGQEGEQKGVNQGERRRRKRGKGFRGEGTVSRNCKEEDSEGGMDELIGSVPVVLQQSEPGDEELCDHIWADLPEELVDRVLARLPIPLLLQLRTVCRRWQSLIISPPFLKLRAAAATHDTTTSPPHFLVFKSQNPKTLQAYNPMTHKWYTLPSASALEDGAILSMASDGGLLCTVMRSSWYSGPTRILLYNPVTQCKRELPTTWVCSQTVMGSPQTPTWIPSLVVLVVDQENNSFKVVAAGLKGSPHDQTSCLCRVTEVFDSVTGRWEKTGDLPWSCIEFDFPSHVVCGGHIYCIATCLGEYRLVAYDLERKVWNSISIQMPTNLLGAQVMLFERGGQLVLVKQKPLPMIHQTGRAFGSLGLPEMFTWRPGPRSLLSSNGNGGSGSSRRREWTRVRASVPRVGGSGKKFEELFRFDPIDLTWGGKGDLVFFVSHKWNRALLYDLAKSSWTVTPMSKFLKLEQLVLRAIPFHFNLQLLS